ncbi:MAG: transposase [Imperialibacter sp.]
MYAYCLMPNHFHFFIKVKDDADEKSTDKALSRVEKAFKDFFISYAKSVNVEQGRTGALFQYKFKRKEVEEPDYYSSLIGYIHFNPVRAKLCEEVSHWQFSSYNAFLSDKPTLVSRSEVLEWFGGPGGFLAFHRSNIEFATKQDWEID